MRWEAVHRLRKMRVAVTAQAGGKETSRLRNLLTWSKSIHLDSTAREVRLVRASMARATHVGATSSDTIRSGRAETVRAQPPTTHTGPEAGLSQPPLTRRRPDSPA